jgi:hypothetical protein
MASDQPPHMFADGTEVQLAAYSQTPVKSRTTAGAQQSNHQYSNKRNPSESSNGSDYPKSFLVLSTESSPPTAESEEYATSMLESPTSPAMTGTAIKEGVITRPTHHIDSESSFFPMTSPLAPRNGSKGRECKDTFD